MFNFQSLWQRCLKIYSLFVSRLSNLRKNCGESFLKYWDDRIKVQQKSPIKKWQGFVLKYELLILSQYSVRKALGTRKNALTNFLNPDFQTIRCFSCGLVSLPQLIPLITNFDTYQFTFKWNSGSYLIRSKAYRTYCANRLFPNYNQ